MASNHKTLTRQGYILSKAKLGTQKVEQIKKELTVKPIVHPDYDKDVEPFEVFSENRSSLCVPRYYGINKFGKPTKEVNIGGNPVNMEFKSRLRENQIPIANECLEQISSGGGGLISLHCGAGKTVLALYLACQLKMRTLVVVHKTFLQNQWYERIQQFTTASIGMIRQKKVDIKNRDIVVGMLQSIALIDYPPETFEQFDCIIIDECHHCPSRVFSRALMKIGGKYTIGLSATPNRADGLMKVCNWYLGDIIYRLERKGDNGVMVKMFNYECNDKKNFVEKKQWMGGKARPFIPKMVTNLCKIKMRNKFLVDIVNTVRQQEDRKILILSGRIAHLEEMKAMLDDIIKQEVERGELEPDEFKTAYYIGKMKEYELADAAEADVIFASYAMAEEGLDIDSLNTLLFATPKRDIVQSVGRILRKPIQEGDRNPIIIDINDCFSVFENWSGKRKTYYEQKKYTVDCYQAYNDRCVSMEEYLKLIGVIKNKQENVDVLKEFIIHKFGEDEYEMMADLGFDDEEVKKDIAKYQYNPDLRKIFEIDFNNEEFDSEYPMVIKI